MPDLRRTSLTFEKHSWFVWNVEPSNKKPQAGPECIAYRVNAGMTQEGLCKKTKLSQKEKPQQGNFCKVRKIPFWKFWFQEITNYHKWQSVYFLDQKGLRFSYFIIYKITKGPPAALLVNSSFWPRRNCWRMVKFRISSPKFAIHQDCAWIAKYRSNARVGIGRLTRASLIYVTLCGWSLRTK